MENSLRRELKRLLNRYYGGTQEDEIKEVLDAIDEVIFEHGLVSEEPTEDLSDDEED